MIVCFGGGKGLSATVKALEMQGKEFSAVVCTIDNGGSTGKLRVKYGIPAIGDFRRIIDVLSKSTLARTMESRVEGHALGNLAILSLIQEFGFEKGLEEYKKRMQVEQNIIPLFLDACDLTATISDKHVVGEVEIDASLGRVKELGLTKYCPVNPKVLDLLKNAETIILGPGSLYTSILPHLINKEMVDAINKIPNRILITGIINDIELTKGFSVSDYVREVEKYVVPTHIVAQKPPKGIEIKEADKRIITGDMVLTNGYHNPLKLGEILCEIL